jgi:hypothetical protein
MRIVGEEPSDPIPMGKVLNDLEVQGIRLVSVVQPDGVTAYIFDRDIRIVPILA